jgi:hypothetical protein
VKTPGDYALMHANGMPWKDIVAAIRAEAIAPYVGGPYDTPPVVMTLIGDATPVADGRESTVDAVKEQRDVFGPLSQQHGETWDRPDARPGTTDHTFTRKSEPEDSTR